MLTYSVGWETLLYLEWMGSFQEHVAFDFSQDPREYQMRGSFEEEEVAFDFAVTFAVSGRV